MTEKHPCKGDYLDKYVQPIVLSLLCEGPAYGFSMLMELERDGLMSTVDATGFYRALKKLEDGGKLESCWHIEKGEKPRKMYTLTATGLRCLQNWRGTIKAHIRYVSQVYELIDNSLERVSAAEQV